MRCPLFKHTRTPRPPEDLERQPAVNQPETRTQGGIAGEPLTRGFGCRSTVRPHAGGSLEPPGQGVGAWTWSGAGRAAGCQQQGAGRCLTSFSLSSSSFGGQLPDGGIPYSGSQSLGRVRSQRRPGLRPNLDSMGKTSGMGVWLGCCEWHPAPAGLFFLMVRGSACSDYLKIKANQSLTARGRCAAL